MKVGNRVGNRNGDSRQAVPSRRGVAKAFQSTTLAFLIASAFGVAGVSAAEAQTKNSAQAAEVAFDIAAQPLATALRAFSAQAHEQVLFDDVAVTGRNAPAVRGRYTPRQALDRLLAGSGIQVIQSRKGVYTLRGGSQGSGVDQTVATLPAVTVTGSAIDPIAERVNPPTTVGSKTPLEQREIPQTVSVVTQEQIQKQNLQTITDALKYSPGITIIEPQSNFALGPAVYSRGWKITNYNLDGIPTTIDSNGLPVSSTAMYDHVEILRGASGLYNGLGGAGGTLNIVRKQPQKEYQINSALGAGTDDNYLGQLDVTGPLNEAGTLRGRAVAAWQRIGRDNSSFDKNSTFYGVLEGDISSKTTAQIGASYEANTGRPDSGTLAYNNGKWLNSSRSDYFFAPWSRYTTDRKTIFGNISHRLDNGWEAKISATYIDTDSLNTNSAPGGLVNAKTGLVPTYWQYIPIESQQQAYDFYAAGPFEFLGRRHELTFGANYQKSSGGYDMYSNSLPILYPFNDIGPSTPPPHQSADYLYFTNSKNEDYGIYTNARFSIADPLTVIVGGRIGWYSAKSNIDTAIGNSKSSTSSKYKYDNKITPFAGIVFDINDTYTAYASYSTIFQPNTLTDRNGKTLKPREGEQYEIGIKGTYLNGRVNGSVALFKGTQKNRPVKDVDTRFYTAAGKTRAQGIDINISGEIIPDLVISAGYSYLITRILDDNTSGTAFGQYAPKHMFKLWADYKLPGKLSRWSIGGGVTAKSSAYNYDFSGKYRYNAGGYAVADARIGYSWSKNTDISLNIGNIFNRYYMSTIAENQYAAGNYLGPGRSAMLTLRTSY